MNKEKENNSSGSLSQHAKNLISFQKYGSFYFCVVIKRFNITAKLLKDLI